MKKTILTSVLLSGLVLVAAPTALAVENDKGESVESSKVQLELKKDDGYEPGTGPFKDKLAIAHKPTTFIYEGDVSKGALLLDNKNEKKDQQFIAVNDDRKDPADKTGKTPMSSKWSLTGKMSKLTIGAKDLAANINFTTGALYQYDIGPIKTVNGKDDFEPKDMLSQGKDVADATKYKLADKSFSLPADDTTEVSFLTSDNDTVTPVHGVYTNLGDNKLAIATGSALEAGKTTGTITWTLAAQK